MHRDDARQSEVRSKFDTFAAKLRAAGGTDAEVETFRARWDDLDDFDELRHASNTTLRALLADMRGADDPVADGELGAVTEGHVLASVYEQTHPVAALYDADEVASKSIPETVAWINSDVERATLVHAMEVRRGDDARKGMLEATSAILGEAQAAQ